MMIDIRQADQSDAPVLFALNTAFNGADCAPIAHIERSLEDNPQEMVLIARVAGRPAGFICGQIVCSMCYRLPHGEVTELYVDPALRRMGVAGALMARMEALFTGAGIQSVHLLTGGKNTGARRFYEKSGYLLKDSRCYFKRLSD